MYINKELIRYLPTVDVDLMRQRNVISGRMVGGVSATDGSLNSTSTSARTCFIPVNFTQEGHYRMTGMPGTKASIFVAAYNSSKQFLGRTGAWVQTSTTSTTLYSTSFTNGTAQGTGDIAYLIVSVYSPTGSYKAGDLLGSVCLTRGTVVQRTGNSIQLSYGHRFYGGNPNDTITFVNNGEMSANHSFALRYLKNPNEADRGLTQDIMVRDTIRSSGSSDKAPATYVLPYALNNYKYIEIEMSRGNDYGSQVARLVNNGSYKTDLWFPYTDYSNEVVIMHVKILLNSTDKKTLTFRYDQLAFKTDGTIQWHTDNSTNYFCYLNGVFGYR